MANSDIYANDADAYFRRNARHRHAATTDRLLQILDRGWLARADVAEFGIGNGQNLFLLKEYCSSVAGFEIGEESVRCVSERLRLHPESERMSVHKVNLAKPFRIEARFDLVMYGFFAYYCDDDEMACVLDNTLAHLKAGGLVHVVDFLSRSPRTKVDCRNDELSLHKRDLAWWTRLMADFDLLDFRLDDTVPKPPDAFPDPQRIDTGISGDDDLWTFSCIFRHRT